MPIGIAEREKYMLPKPRIHFVENFGNVWQLPNSKEWESGYWWRVGKVNADALIDGHIYLHTAQAAPSHHGGIITGYRIHHEGEFMGRYVFRFRPTNQHIGVMGDPGLWSYRYKQMVL